MLMARHEALVAAARIQIFVNDLSATGVVRNAVAIANAAAASGYQVRLLTCRSDGILRKDVCSSVTLVNLVENGIGGSRRSRLLKALLDYRRHSRDWCPDIMLSAGNHGHLLSTIAWLGLPGIKMLRISNDLDHGSPALPTRWWRRFKFAALARCADRLILISRVLRDHPLLSCATAEGKAVTIPNGVDVGAVRQCAQLPCPHRWAGDPSVPTVLVVGRHVPQKNLSLLLDGFAKARREKQLRLIILGDGPPHETERLRFQIERLSIDPDVDLVPATGNPFPYMAAATVLALPSLWEGSSNVLLEAMACGTPVIASRTAGDAEYVLASGRYGLLIDPHNVDELALALLRQTSDERIGPGCRATSFDRSVAVRGYIDLFDHTIGGARTRRQPNCGSASSWSIRSLVSGILAPVHSVSASR